MGGWTVYWFTVVRVGVIIKWCLCWRTNTAVLCGLCYFSSMCSVLFQLKSHLIWLLEMNFKLVFDHLFTVFLLLLQGIWSKKWSSLVPFLSILGHFLFFRIHLIVPTTSFPFSPSLTLNCCISASADYMKNAAAGKWSGAGGCCGLI